MRHSFRIPFLSLGALFLSACDAKVDVDAPAPEIVADVDTLPTLPTSTLDIPLTLDLTSVVRSVERAVPRTFGDLERRRRLRNRRIHIAFEATRSPFAVSLDGQTARMSAVIRYKGRGWYKPPIGPEISSSCGITDSMPRARIAIASPLRITPEWKLRGRTRVTGVTPYSEDRRDECRVTAFKVDVTDRVIRATHAELEKQRAMIDRRIAAVDIRTRFQEWWHLLEKPIPLADSVWLLIRPSAVRMGETVGVRRTLVTARLLGIPCRGLGSRPEVEPTELPPLESAAVGDGLHILMEGVVGYDLATDLLRRHLRGRSVERSGQKIEVTDVRLFGIGGGRLALELRFTGDVRGHVYFVGTPSYDPGTNELFVPDLDYDVESRHLLVSGVEWIRHDEVRDFFRSQARWSVGDVMQTGREQLEKGLNRELAPGVSIAAEVKQVQGLSVHARRDAIRLRAQADANARLTVNTK